MHGGVEVRGLLDDPLAQLLELVVHGDCLSLDSDIQMADAREGWPGASSFNGSGSPGGHLLIPRPMCSGNVAERSRSNPAGWSDPRLRLTTSTSGSVDERVGTVDAARATATDPDAEYMVRVWKHLEAGKQRALFPSRLIVLVDWSRSHTRASSPGTGETELQSSLGNAVAVAISRGGTW